MPRPNRANTVLLGILTTVAVGWALHVGAAILQPLVIALLVASMLQPVVLGLRRFKIPPFVTVVTLVTLMFVGIAQIGLTLQSNISAFIEGKPGAPGWAGLIDRVKDHVIRDEGEFSQLVAYVLETLKDIDLHGLAAGMIGGGFDFIKGLLLVVIYMLFIFAEQTVFKRKILAIAGGRREDAEQVLETISRGIQRYLGVKTVVSLATGALCYAMLQYLEIPFALLFGFLTFLLNYIPTFGSIVAGCFPTITALASGDSPISKAVTVIVTYLAINIALGSIVEPKILGKELNLSPLVVVLSVVVWAGLWGVVGTFLAVPLTATMQIILASHENTRPIAVMLSSGPPREPAGDGIAKPRRRRRRGLERGEGSAPGTL